jgi:hypothetical protein
VRVAIESLCAEEAARELPALSALLEDAVEHGSNARCKLLGGGTP